jgi:serine phosphatase RsbU (regulator of sigma subunit)
VISANYFPIFAGPNRPAGAGLTWSDVTAARVAEGERAELAQRADDAHRRLAVLASASSVLMTTSDVDALLDRLARVLAPSAADWCVIELIGRTGLIDHVAVSHADRDRARLVRDSLVGTPADASPQSPVAEVRRTGQARLLTSADLARAEARDTRDERRSGLARGLDMTSAVVVPIRTRGENLGVLTLAGSGSVALTEDDLDIAVEIAHRAALALGRAITYRNEHVIAEQLQQALLPEHLPSVDRTAIEVRYSATADTATVGGDWYDVIALSPTRVLLSVGDVVGHDTLAAVGMGRLRYLIQAFASEAAADDVSDAPEPNDILSRIDRLVFVEPSAWATCVLAVLDTDPGRLRWSIAGHPPPLLVRDGTVRQLVNGGGAMLGVLRDGMRHVSTVNMFSGDRLLLYTDGLVERRGETLDRGIGRLVDAARTYAHQPLDRFCNEITASMFSRADQTDDMALLAADYV